MQDLTMQCEKSSPVVCFLCIPITKESLICIIKGVKNQLGRKFETSAHHNLWGTCKKMKGMYMKVTVLDLDVFCTRKYLFNLRFLYTVYRGNMKNKKHKPSCIQFTLMTKCVTNIYWREKETQGQHFRWFNIIYSNVFFNINI